MSFDALLKVRMSLAQWAAIQEKEFPTVSGLRRRVKLSRGICPSMCLGRERFLTVNLLRTDKRDRGNSAKARILSPGSTAGASAA